MTLPKSINKFDIDLGQALACSVHCPRQVSGFIVRLYHKIEVKRVEPEHCINDLVINATTGLRIKHPLNRGVELDDVHNGYSATSESSSAGTAGNPAT